VTITQPVTGLNTDVIYTLTWDDLQYDTSGLFPSAPPSQLDRFVIPAGVSYVRLSANVRWENNDDGSRLLYIVKNDDLTNIMPFSAVNAIPKDTDTSLPLTLQNLHTSQNITSPIIPVVQGDFFQVRVYQNSGATLQLGKHDPDPTKKRLKSTWFAIEVVK